CGAWSSAADDLRCPTSANRLERPVPAPDQIAARSLPALVAAPLLPALPAPDARDPSLPDGIRPADRSPAPLLHQSSRSGFAGFRDGAPTLPGFAPVHRRRVSLAGEMQLACCMPNLPTQAVPKTIAAPAQTIVARDTQRNSSNSQCFSPIPHSASGITSAVEGVDGTV